jgi:hypothetical protein
MIKEGFLFSQRKVKVKRVVEDKAEFKKEIKQKKHPSI